MHKHTEYDLQDQVRLNEQGLYEINLNISDATLLGSEDNIENIQENINKYLLHVDNQLINKEAHEMCLKNSKCK